MHQGEAAEMAVLQVFELLAEHDRLGGAVAVDQRDVLFGSWPSTVAAIDSIGVMPEPEAISR